MQVGPDLDDVGLAAALVRVDVRDTADIVATTRRIAASLDAPVQALRADRVLSWTHLVMAAEHARRAIASGRARGRDATVEFVLYATGDRQIHRALSLVGVEPGQAVPVWFVVLERVAAPVLADALQAAHLKPEATWSSEGHGDVPDTVILREGARAWWAERLGLAPDASMRDVEDGILAAMALLAVAKA